MHRYIGFSAVFVCFFATTPAFAQGGGAAVAAPVAEPVAAPAPEPAMEPATEQEEVHQNHIALFVGGTTALSPSHTAFTLGLEYEYRLPVWEHRLGISPFAEVVLESEKAFLGGALVVVHPTAELKIMAGPAFERAAGHTDLVLRGGVGYEIEVSGFSVTPTFQADLVHSEVLLVYGLALGRGF
jgi:hypothetical protein